MNIESFRACCLAKKGVTEEFPFNESTLVFKVIGKMFALTNIDHFEFINLKGDPELNVQLRERYPSVLPGYHMDKRHWNSILMDGSVPDKLVRQWIDQSYDLVVGSLTKSKKLDLSRL